MSWFLLTFFLEVIQKNIRRHKLLKVAQVGWFDIKVEDLGYILFLTFVFPFFSAGGVVLGELVGSDEKVKKVTMVEEETEDEEYNPRRRQRGEISFG